MEDMHMKLFTWSLDDKANMHLQRVSPRSLHTWGDVTTTFMRKYFPLANIAEMVNQIIGFR